MTNHDLRTCEIGPGAGLLFLSVRSAQDVSVSPGWVDPVTGLPLAAGVATTSIGRCSDGRDRRCPVASFHATFRGVPSRLIAASWTLARDLRSEAVSEALAAATPSRPVDLVLDWPADDRPSLRVHRPQSPQGV